MNPPLSPPTDNIYKFSAIFGLALIISSILSLTVLYASALEKKVRYAEKLIDLDSKPQKTPEDKALMELNRQLLEVTKNNEHIGTQWVAVLLALGLLASVHGFYNWSNKIQSRDDNLALLQKERLECEISKLKLEIQKLEQ